MPEGRMAFLINVYVFLISIIHLTEGLTKCDKKSACSCMGDNGLIDLSPLAASGGLPKFKDVSSSTGDQFSWNPCKPFTEGDCKNVAACQIQGGTNFFNIGNQETAKFEVKSGKLTVTYNADTFAGLGRLGFLRKAIITLECDQNVEGTLTATGETPAGSGNYLMNLKSKYACENGGDTIGLSLSVGSILVIVVVVLVLVYIIAGITFQKFVRKAEGKEIVPNIVFWTALPGLIRDGVLFIVKCGKTGSKYDQI